MKHFGDRENAEHGVERERPLLLAVVRAERLLEEHLAAAGHLDHRAVILAGGDVRLHHRLEMLEARRIHAEFGSLSKGSVS